MNIDSDDRIALKRAEVAISRFNDVAIPHHLTLLQKHHRNIKNSLVLGDWTRIKSEEINAMRVIKQIKNILLEMNMLRENIPVECLDRFDALMADGKKKAFSAMEEYLQLDLKAPTKLNRNKTDVLPANGIDNNCTDDEGRNALDEDSSNQFQSYPMLAGQQITLPAISSTFQEERYELKQKQDCLHEMELLQTEIRHLNSMFINMQKIVQEQSTDVDIIAENAEEALENIQATEVNLRKALSYKKAMYPMMGALLGTCLGGPIGLVAGLKAGSLAAVSCGFLGFTGGSIMKSKSILQGNIEESQGYQEFNMELQKTEPSIMIENDNSQNN